MTEQARILVFTGSGKGKTSAALGIVLRSLAHGKKVLLTRFCKARHSGELDILQTYPGMTIISGTCGMTPPESDPQYPNHRAAAQDLFDNTRDNAAGYDVIVMDEVCGAAAKQLLDDSEVVDFLLGLRPNQIAVLTGRNASPALLAMADTVSEIMCLKHGFDCGIPAQAGVEY